MDDIINQFQRGNLARIALSGSSECWQYYAALGLIGVFEKALAGLSRFGCEDALFYTAATLWIQGNDSLAESQLEACTSLSARKLLSLIRAPRIDILAQIPPGISCQYVPDFTDYAEDRFRIKNIAPVKGMCTKWSHLSPPGDIHEYITGDFRPAFFVCREIEWQPLPSNLHELDCPVFGHTEDYDVHLQAVAPLFASFSKIITCGSYEWNELSLMLNVPVCTFPKAYALPGDIPDHMSGERDIDIFLSGTIFHSYHTDKAKLVHRLLAEADESLKLKIVSKHLSSAEYFLTLGRTKICLPFVRNDGSMPTRGLESLAMGNALIVQNGSALPAYFGEEDGVFTCDYWNGDLLPLIKKVSRNWPDIAPCALRGARRVREEFSMKRVTSEYLRFLTVMAAVSQTKDNVGMTPAVGKRSVVSIGWTHDADFYLESLSARAGAFARKPPEDWSASDINDFAREVLLFYAAGADKQIFDKFRSWGRWPLVENSFFSDAMLLLRNGIKLFPRFLALHFNLLRAMAHFDKDEAAVREMAERIAGSQDSDWDISALDDVLPWDFFPDHFNYREYFDLGVKVLGESREKDEGFSRLIRAACAHYASRSGSSLAYSRLACKEDPEFPLYQLDLARRLASMPENRQEAAAILATLASEDLLPLRAWKDILELGLDSELPPEVVGKLSQRTAKIQLRIGI